MLSPLLKSLPATAVQAAVLAPATSWPLRSHWKAGALPPPEIVALKTTVWPLVKGPAGVALTVTEGVMTGETASVTALLPTVEVVAQAALLVSEQVTVAGVVAASLKLAPLPAGVPFTFHSYAGAVPLWKAVVVNKTVSPAQGAVAEGVMVSAGVTCGEMLITIGLLLAESVVAQALLVVVK